MQASGSSHPANTRVYIAPQPCEDSQCWDEVAGTCAELTFAEQWLNALTFIPGWCMGIRLAVRMWAVSACRQQAHACCMHVADELHITQRLVEGIRDLLESTAVYNATRQQGQLLASL